MTFSWLLKRLSHAVALARSQPWDLLNHIVQLYQLKIWKIIRHMQHLINVHFSESRTMCSKSACSTGCDRSAETENSRELRSPSAGPEDLTGYKYTVRPPATKMELILGFLLPNLLHIQAIHPAPEDLCKTRQSNWISGFELSVILKVYIVIIERIKFEIRLLWEAQLVQQGEETTRLWTDRFIYLMQSENCRHTNRSWQIEPCSEIERVDTLSSKGLRKANREKRARK